MLIKTIPFLPFIFFLSLMSFISQRQHILMCLLSLEAMLLSLVFGVAMLNSSLNSMDLYFCIAILAFGACEAGVALAVLVMMARSMGSNLISSSNLVKC